MDPFIIIRNYRQQRQLSEDLPSFPPARVFLRELDPNTLVNRPTQVKNNIKYSEEDKENYSLFMDMDFGEDAMKKFPTPNQAHLINYSDYDLTY